MYGTAVGREGTRNERKKKKEEKRKMRSSIHGLIQQTDHSTSVPVGSLLLNVS